MENPRLELTTLSLQRLEAVLVRAVRLRDAGARPVCGGWDLWIDYAWDDDQGARAEPPLARRSQRCGRARATVMPQRGGGGHGARRALLIALAHIVGEMAGRTGLGFRLLS